MASTAQMHNDDPPADPSNPRVVDVPVNADAAAAQLISARGELSLSDFRRGLETFLVSYTANGSWPYREQLRALSNQMLADSEFNPLDPDAFSREGLLKGIVPMITIDMNHLQSTHWLPGASADLEDIFESAWGSGLNPVPSTQVAELCRCCESIGDALTLLPIKYMTVAEQTVRDVFIVIHGILTSGIAVEAGGPPTASSLAGTNDDSNHLNAILTTLSSTALLNYSAEHLIFQYPSLVELRKSLPQFQICINSRSAPQSIRQLTSSHVEKLVLVPGIVIQVTRPALKTRLLKAECRQCGNGKTFVTPFWKEGVNVPRICDGQNNSSSSDNTGGSTSISSEQKRCPLDPYAIHGCDSSYVDTQTIKMQELPDDVPTGDIPRHIVINATNALVGRVAPGSRVLVCGVYMAAAGGGSEFFALTHKSSKGTKGSAAYVHALNVELLTDVVLSELAAHSGSNNSSNIRPSSILSGSGIANVEAMMASAGLFSGRQCNAFRKLAACPNVVDMISKSIAPSIFGHEDIKTSLACLLFGGSRKELTDSSCLRGDINVLLLGDPSTAKSQFLKFIERVSPIAVYTSGKGSSAAGLTASIVKDQHGNFALEGGAMVLADGGVVCIDEFDKMRDDDRVAIHEAMEQQTISIAKAGINTVLTSKCSILAAANPTFGTYDELKETAEQHNFETTILSRFDCIWLVRDERNLERDRQIASHVYSVYTNNSAGSELNHSDAPVSLDLLKGYVSYARRHCQPRLSPDAASRLENFYVEVRAAARGDKRHKRDQIPITVRQLESLVRLSESFARMSLSDTASISHVELAIQIFRRSSLAAAAANKELKGSLTEDEIVIVRNTEKAIMHRLPLGSRIAKTTIVTDLKARGFETAYIARALNSLILTKVLEERGDCTVKRIGTVT